MSSKVVVWCLVRWDQSSLEGETSPPPAATPHWILWGDGVPSQVRADVTQQNPGVPSALTMLSLRQLPPPWAPARALGGDREALPGFLLPTLRSGNARQWAETIHRLPCVCFPTSGTTVLHHQKTTVCIQFVLFQLRQGRGNPVPVTPPWPRAELPFLVENRREAALRPATHHTPRCATESWERTRATRRRQEDVTGEGGRDASCTSTLRRLRVDLSRREGTCTGSMLVSWPE